MAVYALPLSPNDHPTTAQESLEAVRGHPKMAIFQPTHDGLEMAKSSLVGPHRGANHRNLDIV